MPEPNSDMAEILELSDGGFKIIVINILRTPMKKVDAPLIFRMPWILKAFSMPEQMGR